MRRPLLPALLSALAVLAFLAPAAARGADDDKDKPKKSSEPSTVVHADVSPPLSTISPATKDKSKKAREELHAPAPDNNAADPVVRSATTGAAPLSSGVGFEGVGEGFVGPSSSRPFSVVTFGTRSRRVVGKWR